MSNNASEKHKVLNACLARLEKDSVEHQQLAQQASQIDPQKIERIFLRCTEINKERENELKPLPLVEKLGENKEKTEKWHKDGLEAIKAGKVACLLLAGGQGTRLGYNHPKGMLNPEGNFNLLSKKSLFQLQAERLVRLKNMSGSKTIPWLVMTSDDIHEETTNYFKQNSFFGLPEEDVIFFQQGALPATDLNGEILLSSPHSICLSPNGNGGVYEALKQNGLLEELKKRGVEVIFIYGVDNALVRIGDPVFIGSFIDSKCEAGSKVIPKSSPDEKVGVLCQKNGRVEVVEYSEISSELANKRDDAGNLLFNAANIVTHIFTLDALVKVCDKTEDMPLHLAKKEIKVFDGEKQTSQWGYKYEYFVFDCFQFLDSFFALEVDRFLEFSPIKNKEGDCSPVTAAEQLFKVHRKYLVDAGVIVQGDGPCEISPLLSYSGENLHSFAEKILSTPIYLMTVDQD